MWGKGNRDLKKSLDLNCPICTVCTYCICKLCSIFLLLNTWSTFKDAYWITPRSCRGSWGSCCWCCGYRGRSVWMKSVHLPESEREEPPESLCSARARPPAAPHSPEDAPEEYLEGKKSPFNKNLNNECLNSISVVSVFTCEWWWFAQGAVLVVDVGGAVAGAEGRGGSQHQLLLDEAGFGMILRELHQPLLQRTPEQVQTLGRLTQTTLSLHTSWHERKRYNTGAGGWV